MHRSALRFPANIYEQGQAATRKSFNAMEPFNFLRDVTAFNPNNLEMLLRLLAALVAGTIIGFERTYRGRPAGFRTHALVCMTSCLLMLVTVFQSQWVLEKSDYLIRLDPTRMAQGIMTGIGFLGAGVIMKEGLTVRGLTTAASIWITAAIGILAGIGFYFPLVVSVALTILVLSILRVIENLLPSEAYYHFDVRGERNNEFTEQVVRDLLKSCGFRIAHTSYRLDDKGCERRFSMVLRTSRRTGSACLSGKLEQIDAVHAFRITPISE